MVVYRGLDCVLGPLEEEHTQRPIEQQSTLEDLVSCVDI